MRRNLLAPDGEIFWRGVLQLLPQVANILLHSVYLLLLAEYGAIERIQKIFRQAHFRLDFVQLGFHPAFPGGKLNYICAFDFLPGAAGGT